MEHCDIWSEKLDCLGKYLLTMVYIVEVEHVYRVEQDLEVMGTDLIESLTTSFRTPDYMPCNRFDGQCDTILLCTADNRPEVLDEGLEGLIAPALRAVLVLGIRSTGLGAYHSTAKQGCKADVGVVLLLACLDHCRIRMGKVQIAAKDCNIHLRILEHMPEIVRIAWSQCGSSTWVLLHCLAERKVRTCKALLPDNWKKLLHRQLLCVMQTQSQLDHNLSLLNSSAAVH